MKLFFLLVAVLNVPAVPLRAWDYEGHRLVNELALASLPPDFPRFVLTPAARERIAFLSDEADRWRNSTNLAARHVNAPDHYLDLDELPPYGLSAKTVSPFRYDFVAQLKRAREKHPEQFPRLDPVKNPDHTRDLVGFLPWTINEYFAKLESACSYLKAFEQNGGTPGEIANAQQNVIYYMGVMGHFAGDASQPLHTTKQYNGWIGVNPKHFSTNRAIHGWIDGGFIRAVQLRWDELKRDVRPARSIWSGRHPDGDVFAESMEFLVAQSALVDRLYELERVGQFLPARGDVTDGRRFISGQLLKGGQFLGDLWFSAWQSAPVDKFVKGELIRRAKANSADR